jgi:hypothetical protein
MEKSAQPDEGGGCTPPVTQSNITSKVVKYAPAEEGRSTTLFLLCHIYVLCDSNCRVHIENFGELVERDVDSDSDETITNNNTEHFTKEQIP